MSKHPNIDVNSVSGRKRGRKKQGDFSGESSVTKRQRRSDADRDPKSPENERTEDNNVNITKKESHDRTTFLADDQSTSTGITRKSRQKHQQTRKESMSRNSSGAAGRAGQRKRRQIPVTDSPEKNASTPKIPRNKAKFTDDEDDISMDTSEDKSIPLPDAGDMKDSFVPQGGDEVSNLPLEDTLPRALSTRSHAYGSFSNASVTNGERPSPPHQKTSLRGRPRGKQSAKSLPPPPSNTRSGVRRHKVELPTRYPDIEGLSVPAYREKRETYHQDSYGGPKNRGNQETDSSPDGPTQVCSNKEDSSTRGSSTPCILCAVCIIVLALWWRSVTLNATRQQNLKTDRAFRKSIADLSTTFGNQFATLWKDLSNLRSSHFSAVASDSCRQPLVITLVGFQEDEEVVQCLSRKVGLAFSEGSLLEINGSSIDRYSHGNLKLGLDHEISSFFETADTKVVYVSILKSLSYRDASIFFKYCDNTNTEHPEAVFIFSLTLLRERYPKINTSVQKTVVHEIDRYWVNEKWTDVAEEQSAALAVRLLDSAYFINPEQMTDDIKSQCSV